MFNIGWSELLVIGIVALIVIGPKELPGALRTLGQWMTKVRRMASEFQSQFNEAMREAELADLKKEVDEMATKAQSYANFDPVDDIRKDIESAVGPPPDLNAPASPPASTDAAATTPTVAPDVPQPAVDAAAAPAPVPDTLPPAADTPAPVQTAEPAAAPKDPAVTTTPDTGRAA
jgi:sec-independent protein translocase protein TatB